MFNVNEKDSLSDLLMQEKDIIKVYGTFLPEGSSTQLRNILNKNMGVVAQQQFEIFQTMKSKGYYDVKSADTASINETKKTYSKKPTKS